MRNLSPIISWDSLKSSKIKQKQPMIVNKCFAIELKLYMLLLGEFTLHIRLNMYTCSFSKSNLTRVLAYNHIIDILVIIDFLLCFVNYLRDPK